MRDVIRSAANEKVKRLRRLQKDASARNEEGILLAEGEKLAHEVPKEDILECYVSASYAEKMREIPEDAIVLADGIFEKISDTRTPQGILIVAKRPAFREEEILAGSAPLLLIAEHLQDPGNAGTILRTAEAAGADAVYLTSDSVDIYAPKTVRATMGSVFRVPCFYCDTATALLERLRASGIRTYAAYLDGSVSYEEPDYREGTAFLIGNESRGLTAETASAAAERVRIPMNGRVNSLNAAMAAGILLYEAARQRRAANHF